MGKFLILQTPPALWIGLLLSITIALAAYLKGLRLNRSSTIYLLTGLLLLSISAAGLTWLAPSRQQVLVMIDLSPSTRGAAYRQRALLQERLTQLLAGTPYRTLYFSDTQSPTPPDADPLPDLPSTKTLFQPPSAPAILLFSDGQFPLPAGAPPVYAIIDPNLEKPADASVQQLQIQGNQVVAILNSSDAIPRQIRLTTTRPALPLDIPAGLSLVTTPLPPEATFVTAQLTPAPTDLWPENDKLTLKPPKPLQTEQWWIGPNPPPNWKSLTPTQLPTDPDPYLSPSAVVLNNLSPADLTASQSRRLSQYVQDLSGSLLILDGPETYATKTKPPPDLDSLSPLSTQPPGPATHWLILVDGSGSMDEPIAPAGPSKWQLECKAIADLLPSLPPNDPVTIASFAASLSIWSTGKSAQETATLSLPPPGIFPTGPTNLQKSLESITATLDPLPTQFLLMTDAEADLADTTPLAKSMQARNIHLHVLAVGQGKALPDLRTLSAATGGQVLTNFNPDQWTQGLQTLANQALPIQITTSPKQIQFTHDYASLPPESAPIVGRTYLKEGATPVAQDATQPSIITAAQWNLGEGRVLSTAFSPSQSAIDQFIKQIARPPGDPRIQIAWDVDRNVKVTIDAVENSTYLNNLDFELQTQVEDPSASMMPPQRHPIPQTAPGHYELTFDPQPIPLLATVQQITPEHSSRTLQTRELPSRYPLEFDQIGNNRPILAELSRRTQGAVIEPTDKRPIEFNWPKGQVEIWPWTALAAVICLILGLFVRPH